MSLSSTLALLRPALPSYVHLTQYHLIVCQRDTFQFNLESKAPPLAQEMAQAMFALGASSVIEGYTMSRMLADGPKVFSFDALTCEALENFELNVSCADYQQPFPSVVIELPRITSSGGWCRSSGAPTPPTSPWSTTTRPPMWCC